MPARKNDTFTVVYRTGGTERCFWHRTHPCATRKEAEELKANCERMGYKAIIHITRELDAIGMPEGWNA